VEVLRRPGRAHAVLRLGGKHQGREAQARLRIDPGRDQMGRRMRDAAAFEAKIQVRSAVVLEVVDQSCHQQELGRTRRQPVQLAQH